jgi:hypothetical protein
LNSLKYFNEHKKYFIFKGVPSVPQGLVAKYKLAGKKLSIMSNSETVQISYVGFILSNYESEKQNRKSDGIYLSFLSILSISKVLCWVIMVCICGSREKAEG